MNEIWENHPDIWKTKAEFFTYLRGALRKALWQYYPVKIKFKNMNCHPPPDGVITRAKSGAYCALSNNWIGKSAIEVDHIKGNVSLRDWNDVLPFVQHLCADFDNLQLVSKEAHKIKSYAEKQGISFQEAELEKYLIQLIKEESKQNILDFLSDYGHNDVKAKDIRNTLRNLFVEYCYGGKI